jgi:phosphonate ABC transporter permease subunit PhnE
VAFRTDGEGRFSEEVTFPDIRASEKPQRVEIEEVLSRRIVGLSDTVYLTIEKIVETVLLALMASTVGTLLAVPISFLAARNLMINVNQPLAGVMGGVVGLAAGWWLGARVSSLVISLAGQAAEQTWAGVGVFVLASALIWPVLRLGPSVLADEQQGRSTRLLSFARLVVALVLGLLGIGLLAHLGLVFGEWLQDSLGPLGFLGNFVFVAADFVRLTMPFTVGLIVGLAAASAASGYGDEAVLRLQSGPGRLLTAVLTGIGAALIVYGIGAGLNWLYQFDQPQYWMEIPAAAAGVAGAIVGALVAPKRAVPIGFTLYTVMRGILNGLRSIEPIIMAIVFVVWVGVGPFAGVLALALHSVAALGKLFSEQVESIAEGPVEAITATGANRLQTVAYAVVPQIIPPFIAFTFYRWDINVRMSTIIGIVGGGGIGFVLQQATSLLRYQQASVMMIAIAIVVSTLDYISSKIRSRII